MFRVGREAAALRRGRTPGLSALSRIIPQAKSDRGVRAADAGRDLLFAGSRRLHDLFCAGVGTVLPGLLPPGLPLAGAVEEGRSCRDVRRCARPASVWGRGPVGAVGHGDDEVAVASRHPGGLLRGHAADGSGWVRGGHPRHAGQRHVFGRPGGSRAPGAFPQAHVLGLVEAGTHVFWRWLIKPFHIGEIAMTPPLLSTWTGNAADVGPQLPQLSSCAAGHSSGGTHSVARVKNDLIFRPIRRLRDGSYLAKLYRNATDRKHDRQGILVRIIEYTFDDPQRPRHRREASPADHAAGRGMTRPRRWWSFIMCVGKKNWPLTIQDPRDGAAGVAEPNAGRRGARTSTV